MQEWMKSKIRKNIIRDLNHITDEIENAIDAQGDYGISDYHKECALRFAMEHIIRYVTDAEYKDTLADIAEACERLENG